MRMSSFQNFQLGLLLVGRKNFDLASATAGQRDRGIAFFRTVIQDMNPAPRAFSPEQRHDAVGRSDFDRSISAELAEVLKQQLRGLRAKSLLRVKDVVLRCV